MKQLFSTNRKARRAHLNRTKHHNAKNPYIQIIDLGNGSHKVIRHMPKPSSGIYSQNKTK